MLSDLYSPTNQWSCFLWFCCQY